MKKIINYTLGLTAIMVIAFCYSKKETKIRVLKSAEILFNLNEGSLRNVFNTAEKEISKVNGSSSDLFTSKETKNLPPHSSEAWNYYKEICLHDEYGGTNKKFKWKRDVKIYVHGSCRDYMMDELDRIVKDLNRIINTIEIKVVKNRSEANTFIFLGSAKGFELSYPKIQESYLKGNWGYFEVYPSSGAVMYVEMLKTGDNTTAQKSILREELTQSLGLFNDSKKYPESIFYQYSNTNTEYAPIDEEIIDILYNN
jgi:hypothetical protein